MGTLTVRESLMFSATLRLPSCLSHDQKKRRVADVLNELGLIRCANSKVINYLYVSVGIYGA